MRRVLAVVLLAFGSIAAVADEYLITTVGCTTYNEVSKLLEEAGLEGSYGEQIDIKHDSAYGDFYLVLSNRVERETVRIILHRPQMDTLRAILAKYLEWEQIVITNAVEIDKTIPHSVFLVDVNWRFGNDWYDGKNLSLSFDFVSQSKTRHQLVISSGEIPCLASFHSPRFPTEGETKFYKLNPLYFDKDQVLSLQKGITPEAIQKAMDEYIKKKKVENLLQ
ncbi:hypothetical protein ES705_33502 [subsurface metagenome]